jgi:hypothetical protein
VSRLPLAAAVLALIPAAAFAANPADDAPGAAKPAHSSAVKPATFTTAPPPTLFYPEMPPGYQYYGLHLQAQAWLDRHNCAPDGCPKPIGCGNFWTEKKFIFGSCRQFFGTAESTVGHGYHTTERPK